MKTKIILYLLVVIFLNACGHHDLDIKKKKYLFIAKEREQSFHEVLMTGVKKEMVKLHVDVDFKAAKNQGDIGSQKEFLRQAIATRKYDGIMLCPNDSKALLEDIKKLNGADIPYVIIDTALENSTDTQDLKNDCGYVGTDNLEVGRMAMRFISDRVKGGRVLMVRGIHQHRSSIDRENGFLEEMNKLPSFRVIHFLQGEWKKKETYNAFLKFTKNSSENPDAIFAYNDYMALGISQYYDQNPKLKRPIIVGVDGTVVGQKGLLEGKIDAIVVQTAELMGIDGLRRIHECVSRSPIRKIQHFTPVTLLTSTTALKRME